MRLLLAIALILLFLWLHNAQTSDDTSRGSPCKASSVSETVVSFLLSPLFLYSWLTSTLVRLLLSVPALVLNSLHSSLLLLLAGPWCIATTFLYLMLTCLQVAVYLFHLALVVGAVAILTLARHKMADGDTAKETPLHQQKKKLENRSSKSGLRALFGRGTAQQG